MIEKNDKIQPVKMSPLIIIGMHRSGTTLLSKILEDSGVFMGVKKEVNNESVFFLKINDWIMRQFNASWDQPYNMNFLDNKTIDLIKKAIIPSLKDIRSIEFLGLKNYFKYKDIRRLDIPWGWKDPRTTFTLDIWLKIFPEARILHIYRNPIDVAESLRKREEELDLIFKMTSIKKIKEYLLKGKVGYISSIRVRHIREGVFLWKEYVEKSFSYDKVTKNILHIKYEDLLNNPKSQLEKIFDFIEIPYVDKDISMAINTFRIDRKYAFTKDNFLVSIYHEIKDWPIMKKLGYDNIPC